MQSPHDTRDTTRTSLRPYIARGAAMGLGLMAVCVPAWLLAVPVGSLTSFSNGNVADASAVNGNFAALKASADSHEAALTAVTPTVFAYGGPDQITGTGPTPIRFIAESVDTDSSYDPVNSRFTAKVAGNYLVNTSWMSFNRNTYTRYALHKNGALYGDHLFVQPTAYDRVASSWIVPLAVGDSIQIIGDVGSAGEINIHVNYRNLTIQLVK